MNSVDAALPLRLGKIGVADDGYTIPRSTNFSSILVSLAVAALFAAIDDDRRRALHCGVPYLRSEQLLALSALDATRGDDDINFGASSPGTWPSCASPILGRRNRSVAHPRTERPAALLESRYTNSHPSIRPARRLRDVRSKASVIAPNDVLEVPIAARPRQHAARQPDLGRRTLPARCDRPGKEAAKVVAASITATVAAIVRHRRQCIIFCARLIRGINLHRDNSGLFQQALFSSWSFVGHRAKEGNQRLGRDRNHRHLGGARDTDASPATSAVSPKLSRCCSITSTPASTYLS